MTTLREKLVKIGAKLVRHARSITFQLAEVAVPRRLWPAAVNRSGEPTLRLGQRALRREHCHFAKTPQIRHQTHWTAASRSDLHPKTGASATACLPDGLPGGTILSGGRSNGGCPATDFLLPGDELARGRRTWASTFRTHQNVRPGRRSGRRAPGGH